MKKTIINVTPMDFQQKTDKRRKQASSLAPNTQRFN